MPFQISESGRAVGSFYNHYSKLGIAYFDTQQRMEQCTFENVNTYLNTNICSYLETSGGQSSYLYLNVAHFFQHQCYLDIYGSLRQLFSCIGV
jgi:hypothetical protein